MIDDSLADVMAGLGAVVLERRADASFRMVGRPPAWLQDFLPATRLDDARFDPAQLSPFLENFLIDAEEFWGRGAPGRVYSGVWTEGIPGERDLPLEAVAVRLENGRNLLLVESVYSKYLERVGLLQRARSASLEHEQLQAETQKKEVLLHCIVHDLKQPLAGMMGSLSLLQSSSLSDERSAEMLTMGLQQARRQEEMIRQVLDVFSAEVESMETFERTQDTAPDLARAVAEVARGMEPAFLDRDVALEIVVDAEAQLRVVGRMDRLARVLANLLENALRHAPTGTTVTIGARRESDGVTAWVEDRGPGVPPEALDGLFEKFARGSSLGGTAGLGLYFCRYTVETWGGSIAYEPREEGGARFRLWLESPSA